MAVYIEGQLRNGGKKPINVEIERSANNEQNNKCNCLMATNSGALLLFFMCQQEHFLTYPGEAIEIYGTGTVASHNK